MSAATDISHWHFQPSSSSRAGVRHAAQWDTGEGLGMLNPRVWARRDLINLIIDQDMNVEAVDFDE